MHFGCLCTLISYKNCDIMHVQLIDHQNNTGTGLYVLRCIVFLYKVTFLPTGMHNLAIELFLFIHVCKS